MIQAECTLSISIVLYKTNFDQLVKCLLSIKSCNCICKIILVDNSPSNELLGIRSIFPDVEYIFNPNNPGYGTSHNLAINKILNLNHKFHLVLNADVYFDTGTLESLFQYMMLNEQVGLVMPLVLFPDGRIQYLCKFLPSPYDLLSRLFLPNYINKNNIKFEMRASGYNQEMFVPFLSGCFMFLRISALREIGIFDERFFMYAEDIDLTRRIARLYKSMFYPKAVIYHEYGAVSKKSLKMLSIHCFNIIKYFNKWGWFFDSERSRFNKLALTGLKDAKQRDATLI